MAVADIITKIDAAIEALVDNPQVTYKIGNKTVNASDKMKHLLMARKELIASPDAELALVAFDIDISQFGEDNSQQVL